MGTGPFFNPSSQSESIFFYFLSPIKIKKMFKQKFATFYADMPYNIFREDYCISCNLMGKFYLWSNYLF